MSRGFVKLPHDLLEDPRLSDAALRLWAVIRRHNGESKFAPCWSSLSTLDRKLSPGRVAKHVSSRLRRAYRELRDVGLVVVKRHRGTSAHRWALSPGADGELELRELRDRGEIGDQLLAMTNARRDARIPTPGTVASRLPGRQHPTIQNPAIQSPGSRGSYPGKVNGDGKEGEHRGFRWLDQRSRSSLASGMSGNQGA